jgi:hypothetical protein
MSKLLQDLTYLRISLNSQLKDTQALKQHTEGKDWQAFFRGKEQALSACIARLSTIIKKEEKRIGRPAVIKVKKTGKTKPQKLTKGLLNKFEYL